MSSPNNVSKTMEPTDTSFSELESYPEDSEKRTNAGIEGDQLLYSNTALLPHTSEIDPTNLQITGGLDISV